MGSGRADGKSEIFKGILQKGPLEPPLLQTKDVIYVCMAIYQISF